ncbi:dihydroxyacetone kinase phosphoryl donor subunit DhaM [Microbacterium sp. 1P10UB]|uniref:dihydroxyacetone kinase phosphoryl donor subunit DhaM n=1 Tax=unclassified Microbacterium TaxID=2609290 RepID=UPI0039A24C46
MIGIVAVSHSPALAAAARELALQMGGDDPPLVEIAAGTPDGELGTDAAAIAEAVERASSDDGVLILMDLGSAILSAETALEFVDPEITVRLSPAPFVEGLVAAVVGAASGSDLDAIIAQLDTALAAKRQQLGLEEELPPTTDAAAPAPADETASRESIDDAPADDGELSFEAVIRNPSGLHARPAASFARAAGRFDARVTLTDLGSQMAPVAANSLLALMAMGIGRGAKVRVTATGREARAALDELRGMIEDGFGEM